MTTKASKVQHIEDNAVGNFSLTSKKLATGTSKAATKPANSKGDNRGLASIKKYTERYITIR